STYERTVAGEPRDIKSNNGWENGRQTEKSIPDFQHTSYHHVNVPSNMAQWNGCNESFILLQVVRALSVSVKAALALMPRYLPLKLTFMSHRCCSITDAADMRFGLVLLTPKENPFPSCKRENVYVAVCKLARVLPSSSIFALDIDIKTNLCDR
ncbi:hypothetical protein V1478_008550, partial [Vespula squamosa]